MTESHYDFIQASRDFPNIQQRGLKERQGDAAPPVGWLVVEDLHVHTYGPKFKWLKQIKSTKKMFSFWLWRYYDFGLWLIGPSKAQFASGSTVQFGSARFAFLWVYIHVYNLKRKKVLNLLGQRHHEAGWNSQVS